MELSLLSRQSLLILVFIVLGSITLRLPPLLHQPGRVDEECYAIPGLTILQCGLPQLPHMPSRNPVSMFYRADEILYSEPPLFFYLQALVYSLFSPTYAAARSVSLVAGGLAILVAAQLAIRWSGTVLAGYLTALLLGLTKWFSYGITLARPDMLCTFFGLAAVLTVDRWIRTGHRRWLVGTGICLGLAGLTLPLALAIAVQIAGWLFLESRGWQRVLNPLFIAAVAAAVFSLWILLILVDPQTFRIQFHNQFLDNQLLVIDGHEPPDWWTIFGDE